MTTTSTMAGSRGAVRPVQVIALVVGPALVMLDSGIANVAIAPLAQQFDRPVSAAQWIVSAYLLAIAVGLVATAQLTQRFGARRVYVVSLLAFTTASAACALAGDLDVLIALRTLQGLAGAPLVPLAMTALMPSCDDGPSQVNPAIGAVLFMAPVLGPPVAGLILAVATWPWLFIVNVPLGLAGLWLSRHLSEEIFPARRARQTMDLAGFALLAPGVILLVLAGANIGHRGAGRGDLLVVGSAGLALIAAYLWHARRTAAPLVDLSPLSTRASAAALGASVLTSVIAFSLVVLIPIFAQGVQGYSPATTGLALLPQGLAVGIGTGIAYALSRKVSLRATIVVGLLLLLVCLAGMYLLVDAETPLWITALLLSGRGLAIGLVIQPLLSGWLSTIPSQVTTDATTIFTTTERIAGSLGIASIISLYSHTLSRSGPDAAIHTVIAVLIVLAILVLALAPLLPTGRPTKTTPREDPSTTGVKTSAPPPATR